MKLFHGHFDKFSAPQVRGGEFLDGFGIHLGISFISAHPVTGSLDLAARADPFPDRRRTLGGILAC